MYNQTIAAIAIFVIVVCLFLAIFFGLFDNHVKIACGIAGLASVPRNAIVLRSGGWSTGFSNQSCFVFKATKQEIGQWISNSPSLRDNTPDVLSENHRLISFDSFDEMKEWKKRHSNHDLVDTLNGYELVQKSKIYPEYYQNLEIHYYNIPTDPSWFRPNIRKGRLFDISRYYCSVFVDDANNVVWVTASSS